MSKRKRWVGRIYLGQGPDGGQRYKWVGRFATRRERDEAVAAARIALRDRRRRMPTVAEYLGRYLEEYGRRRKWSSYDTARSALASFRAELGHRRLDSIDRQEAKEWAARVPASRVPPVVAMFNHAVRDDELLARNPFRGLGRKTRGRSDRPPPSEAEFERLCDACSALGRHGPEMRALLRFAAFTLMRPSELYALEWQDIDFEGMRIHKRRRVYRGGVDVPKTGVKVVALTPPARDAVLALDRSRRLVFVSRTGRRLSQSTMSGYWAQVQARAGLRFDFYHATKHFGVWWMWTRLGLSRRAIAAQAGWSLGAVDKLLAVYGHGDVGALDEVDEAFRAGLKVVPLRSLGGGAA